ncbi:LOW QUALITY PROTEIN: uncharacterized protein LOC34622767 [Cyclospora cayetanensis]|uniref:LOW QUALITY PROTEIN: uncharacterized protein LOC34622767 n=1 Tax=Cyclospora cayetanensis TaxID=88456 RepID=A0A6P6S1I9_9EIME|nr:LOW QUALITY PROTEIN: uncharacterized protein LOC34622767 [Cyclospora cayetanensis]
MCADVGYSEKRFKEAAEPQGHVVDISEFSGGRAAVSGPLWRQRQQCHPRWMDRCASETLTARTTAYSSPFYLKTQAMHTDSACDAEAAAATAHCSTSKGKSLNDHGGDTSSSAGDDPKKNGYPLDESVSNSKTRPCVMSAESFLLRRLHPHFAVGDRVRTVESLEGVVRYVGLLRLNSAEGDLPSAVSQKGTFTTPELATGEKGDAEKEDLWIGVQWDDPAHGKHDGCTHGIRYFCCCALSRSSSSFSHASRSSRMLRRQGASFVRPQKLQQPLTFREALLLRYTTKLTAEEVAAMRVADAKTLREKPVQFCGWQEAQQHFEKIKELEAITLSTLPITSAGLDALCLPRLCTLSMSGSLLRDWGELLLILRSCPSLKALSLAHTRMDLWFKRLLLKCAAPPGAAASADAHASASAEEASNGSCRIASVIAQVLLRQNSKELPDASADGAAPEVADGNCCCASSSLESLCLDGTFVSWGDLLCFNHFAPNLKKLSLRANGLGSRSRFPLFRLQSAAKRSLEACVAEPTQQQQQEEDQDGVFFCACTRCSHPFAELEALDVSSNALNCCLSVLAAIGHLPRLQRMSAADNGISAFCLPPSLVRELQQKEQKELQATGSWSLLEFYEALCGARRDTLRNVVELCLDVVSLFPRLAWLNGSEVSKEDRCACERYALSICNRGALGPLLTLFSALRDTLADSNAAEASTASLAAAAVCVCRKPVSSMCSGSVTALRLRPDAPQCLRQTTVSKRLPRGLTIRDLKVVCMRIFGIPVHTMRLLCNDRGSPVSEEMCDEALTLELYGVQDNSIIRVQATFKIKCLTATAPIWLFATSPLPLRGAPRSPNTKDSSKHQTSYGSLATLNIDLILFPALAAVWGSPCAAVRWTLLGAIAVVAASLPRRERERR